MIARRLNRFVFFNWYLPANWKESCKQPDTSIITFQMCEVFSEPVKNRCKPKYCDYKQQKFPRWNLPHISTLSSFRLKSPFWRSVSNIIILRLKYVCCATN